MSEQIPTVKTLTNILRAIAARPKKEHPEKRFADLAPLPDEKSSTYRVRALAVIGSWWDRTADSVRAMEDGHRHGKDSPGFLRDLQKYGAAKFKRDGSLDPRSLGKGPDMVTYLSSLPARKRPVRNGARAI